MKSSSEGVSISANTNPGKEDQLVITVPGHVTIQYVNRGDDGFGNPVTLVTVAPDQPVAAHPR